MRYIDTREDIIKKYFNILSPDYPEWLDKYIETDVMLKQQYISVSCGKIYAKMFNLKHDYSSLDHSIAVALIIWHFTHDKKQTLSGLFHDIATPAFKHCVDFLNGDWMNQESTEDETTYMIKNSDEIMHLLERDNIKLEEVNDYHLYPIADNDTPHLSADRLEYSLSNAFLVYGIDSIDSIKEMYCDIEIQKDENNITELGFKSERLAERFVKNTSYLSVSYRDDGTRFYMQLVADILKRLSNDSLITKADLYNMKESEVIDLILNSKYGSIYKTAIKIDKVNTSSTEPDDCYNVHHGAKIRYIDPLLNGERISDNSITVNQMIKDNLSYKMDDYLYIDRSFNILNDNKSLLTDETRKHINDAIMQRLGITYEEYSSLDFDEQQRLLEEKRDKDINSDKVNVMFGYGEHSIIHKVKKGKKVMVRYGNIIEAGLTRKEQMQRMEDELDDILYSKPVACVKKLIRRINNK